MRDYVYIMFDLNLRHKFFFDLRVMGLNQLRLSFAHPIDFWPIFKAWGRNIKRAITTLAVVQSFEDSDQLAFPNQSIGTIAALGIDLFKRDPPDGMGVDTCWHGVVNSVAYSDATPWLILDRVAGAQPQLQQQWKGPRKPPMEVGNEDV
jgi:hypothetical protein